MSRNAGKIHGRSLLAALAGGLALTLATGAARADVIVVDLHDAPVVRTNLGALDYRGTAEPFVPDLTISDHTVNERWIPDPPGDPDPMLDPDGGRTALERARGSALGGFTAPSAGGPLPSVPPAGAGPAPTASAPYASEAGGPGGAGMSAPFAPGQQPPIPAPGVLPILGLLALASRRRRRLRAQADATDLG